MVIPSLGAHRSAVRTSRAKQVLIRFNSRLYAPLLSLLPNRTDYNSLCVYTQMTGRQKPKDLRDCAIGLSAHGWMQDGPDGRPP